MSRDGDKMVGTLRESLGAIRGLLPNPPMVSKEKTLVARFSSVTDLVSFQDPDPAEWSKIDGRRVRTWFHGNSGVKSYEEALQRYAGIGMEPFWERLRELSDGIMLSSHILQPDNSVRYGMQGFGVDTGRFLAGDPECMMNFLEPSPCKTVRILKNLGAHCGISEQSLVNAGAMAFAVVNALEDAGIRCELTVCYAANSRLNTVVLVPTKMPNEPFSESVAAYATCHPSFLRTFIFSALECLPDHRERGAYEGGGHGSPSEPPQDILDEFDIYLPPPIDYGGLDQYKTLFKQIVSAQGIAFEEEEPNE